MGFCHFLSITYIVKTSPKGFSASKCDVGNWLEEYCGRNFLGGIFWEEFFGRIFLKEFFGRNFSGGIFWEELFGRNFLFTLWYLNMEGIDLYVKIMVFVKILSQ